MPRVVRQPRNSVQDRPHAIALLLRRQRWLLRPAVFSLSALLLLMVLLLGVRAGGNAIGGVGGRFANLAAAFGMRVVSVRVQGRINTPEQALREAIGIEKGDPTLGFSLADTQARIKSLAWVESATVERHLPGTIVIQLTEKHPFAIWQNNNKFVLVDREGQVVADQDMAQFKDLPLVVGAGAPAAAATLLDALHDRPILAARVVAATRIGERRWNLRLNNGADVLLPEGAEVAALDRLLALQQDHALLDRALQTVDMRLPDRLVLHPGSPGAATGAAGAAEPRRGDKPT